METGFFDTPRIPNKPIDKRVGDNRLIRDKNGNVSLYFGWYTRSQELARKRWGMKFKEEFEKP